MSSWPSWDRAALGKTTLLQLLGALDRPTAGEVLFEGRDMARLGDAELSRIRLSSIGFVFQQFNLIPTLTAAQNVEVALAPARGGAPGDASGFVRYSTRSGSPPAATTSRASSRAASSSASRSRAPSRTSRT